MYKNPWTVSLIALIAGAFGTFFRWLQNINAFEEETGLNITGSIWNYLMVVICIVSALAFLIICLYMKNYKAPRDLYSAFTGPEPFKKFVVIALGGLMAIGAIVTIINAGEAEFPMLRKILGVFALIAGVGYPAVMEAKPSEESHNQTPWIVCLLSASAALLFAFWLIVCYKENAEDPIIWDYLVEILAAAASALSFYYFSGYAFGKSQPMTTLFFSMLGTFFCMTVIADMQEAGRQLIFISAALIQTVNVWFIVKNLASREQVEKS